MKRRKTNRQNIDQKRFQWIFRRRRKKIPKFDCFAELEHKTTSQLSDWKQIQNIENRSQLSEGYVPTGIN